MEYIWSMTEYVESEVKSLKWADIRNFDKISFFSTYHNVNKLAVSGKSNIENRKQINQLPPNIEYQKCSIFAEIYEVVISEEFCLNGTGLHKRQIL